MVAGRECDDGVGPDLGCGVGRSDDEDVVALGLGEVGDLVGPEALGDDEGVGAGAAGERVVSAAAQEDVIAGAAGDLVVAQAAVEGVVPVAAVDDVVERVADDDVVQRIAGSGPGAGRIVADHQVLDIGFQRVVGMRDDRVGPAIGLLDDDRFALRVEHIVGVVARTAGEGVGAAVAVEGVVAGAAGERVAAAVAVDGVVAVRAHEVFGLIGADIFTA